MMTFTRQPSHASLYWQVLRARKPRLVPPGATVPRLEARWTDVRVDEEHLREYRALCGFQGDALPLPYPHVMVSAMHLAMLAAPGFPVRLLGLVHLANRIEVLGALPRQGGGELCTWLEGHEDLERVQRFDLHTEWLHTGAVCWRERCTFIVKKPAPRRDGPRAAPEPRPAPTARATFEVPPGLGRRYSRVGGDINPIHLWDVTAKLFGFERAIIHGMWSLGRCVAELQPQGPCVVDVQFKLPVFIPATVTLERVARSDGEDFALFDARGEKPHLVGTLRR